MQAGLGCDGRLAGAGEGIGHARLPGTMALRENQEEALCGTLSNGYRFVLWRMPPDIARHGSSHFR
jgi:hypothetical protein